MITSNGIVIGTAVDQCQKTGMSLVPRGRAPAFQLQIRMLPYVLQVSMDEGLTIRNQKQFWDSILQEPAIHEIIAVDACTFLVKVDPAVTVIAASEIIQRHVREAGVVRTGA